MAAVYVQVSATKPVVHSFLPGIATAPNAASSVALRSRRSGGLDAASFSVIQGADLLGSYDKTPATRMRFCTRCGSSLFTEKLLSKMVHLRLGTLDTEPSVWPQFHVHVESLPAWSAICDGLPCVDGNPTEQQAEEFRDQARALFAAGRTS